MLRYQHLQLPPDVAKFSFCYKNKHKLLNVQCSHLMKLLPPSFPSTGVLVQAVLTLTLTQYYYGFETNLTIINSLDSFSIIYQHLPKVCMSFELSLLSCRIPPPTQHLPHFTVIWFLHGSPLFYPESLMGKLFSYWSLVYQLAHRKDATLSILFGMSSTLSAFRWFNNSSIDNQVFST